MGKTTVCDTMGGSDAVLETPADPSSDLLRRSPVPELNLFDSAHAGKRPSGIDNPAWKGGRSIASNGYMLIRVGAAHHLADVRGYAYEHRLNAEKKIGRRLQPGDNRPDNLVVCKGNAEHFVYHRVVGCDLRKPDEPNPIVRCACGCGAEFQRFDAYGRPRDYSSGHNEHSAPTMLAVAATLESGPRTRAEIVSELDASVQAVAVCLSKMKRRGLVINPARGMWALRQ